MHLLEIFEPFAWLIAIFVVLCVIWTWIVFPFKVLNRLDQLIETNRQTNFYLASLNERLGAAEIIQKEE